MESLKVIAGHLELLEETLIYRFLERAQFAAYPALYRGALPEDILRHSLLGLRLRACEAIELDFGRYDVAEEFPFSPFTIEAIAQASAKANAQGLPQAAKPYTASPSILAKLGYQADKNIATDLPFPLPQIRQISQCPQILQHYLAFLARHCRQQDGQYGAPQHGSALEHDVMALQAISRRIHYGAIYIAEMKFRELQATLRPCILAWQQAASASNTQDSRDDIQASKEQILNLITRPEIEQKILQRVYDKASAIQPNNLECPLERPKKTMAGTAKNGMARQVKMQRFYLDPQALRNFYADCVIPLTKNGELAYLYCRVD